MPVRMPPEDPKAKAAREARERAEHMAKYRAGKVQLAEITPAEREKIAQLIQTRGMASTIVVGMGRPKSD